MPLEKFLNEKKPTTRLDRYLAIARWFKEYRGTDTISADHIHTAYRAMGWGNDIADVAQPFRDLMRVGKGDTKKSLFTINHLGEAAVDKLTGAK
jgi:hypothetical protein